MSVGVLVGGQTLREKITQSIKDNFKSEEKPGASNPFATDKTTALQEAKSAFSDPHLKSKKCATLVTKVLWLITQAESFSPMETSDLFFGATKLFQTANDRLRRLTYLLIKSLKVNEGEVFIVTSTLTKDMCNKLDCYRANAIRVLSKTIDPQMAIQLERYLKVAIVDRSAFVCSAALTFAIKLSATNSDLVKRWVNEIHEALTSRSGMVQCHALILMYEIRKNDRLALHKVLSQVTKSLSKNAMAETLLVRYAAQTAKLDRVGQKLDRGLMDFLETSLRAKHEMTMFEAAKAFCEFAISDSGDDSATTYVCGYDMVPALTVLQIFLGSPKPAIRFATIRLLSRLSQVRPQVVARCNSDMEALLTDSNSNIATLALTTLLKTGHESSVERLIKQISSFMGDISDNFKREVVNAVTNLCLTFPSKYRSILSFLATVLRDEGTAEFKKAVVDTIFLITRSVPETREMALLQLCEFIEDCEYPSLCTLILSFLSEESPKTSQPSKFVRFIYNRLILENAFVRAAGVDALSKIASQCPPLKKDILTLLESCTLDNDDEVRDRANLYYRVLDPTACKKGPIPHAEEVLKAELANISVDALCDALEEHISQGAPTPLDLSKIPTEEEYQAQKAAAVASQQAAAAGETQNKGHPPVGGVSARPLTQLRQPSIEGASGSSTHTKTQDTSQANVAEMLSALSPILGPDPNVIGRFSHSCPTKQLTEDEAEYVVRATKHLFISSDQEGSGQTTIVIEYQVINTIQDTILENVELDVKVQGEQMKTGTIIGSAGIARLSFDTPASAYFVFSTPSPSMGGNVGGVVTGFIKTTLVYLVKEDGDDAGFKDAYSMEAIAVQAGDFVAARALRTGEFKGTWDAMGQEAEAVAKYQLSFKTIDQAVRSVTATLGMAPCDRTDKVDQAQQQPKGHTLLLSGVFIGGVQVLIRALIGIDPQYGCLLKLSCRSSNADVNQLLTKAVE